jgi:FtsP/CotA-like multicopper oxidase with cupredoxin domain
MSPSSAFASFAVVALVGTQLLAACGSSPRADKPVDPWQALTPARDDNPAADVVEIQLEAAEATKVYAGATATKVWAYNGTVPGPLIDVKVGDKLIVHFKNSLPEPTTIHWHGVRVPAPMDGTPAMQAPIAPGGTFDYAFTLRDAGLFWFHPHIRGDVQVHKGLYGVIRVRGANEPVVDREGVLVLDDVTVMPDGTLSEYLDDASKMLGRQGKTLLVNGMAMPKLAVQSGSLVRLRIVNVANGRFFNLALAGHVWRVIGTDGGFLPKPYDTEHLLIAPGERYDVILVPSGAPGTEITLMDDPYERGHDTGKDPPLPVATFRITNQPPLTSRALPNSFPDLERLPGGAVDHPVVLDEGIVNGEMTFTMNGASFPNVPPLDIPLGAVRRILLDNRSEMDHPFHIHGVFFQLLAKGGVQFPADALANKDTVIVPMKTTLEVVARFDAPGSWMYHCHILEHAEGGMMGVIEVK